MQLSARVRAAVVSIFFFSGCSGLVYQIVWVRQLARTFGNTIHSAALVTGVFMGGLGVGSFVVGRRCDRRYQSDPAYPLRAYGRAELAIGAIGLGLALLLPRLPVISAVISTYRRGEHGWYELSAAAHAARYAVAIVAVAPATFLMGGTLTLLVRAVVGRDVASAGVRVGVLYGVNTCGAALGALLTDFALVPKLGLFGAQLVAVALNAGAGLAALALVRWGGARGEPALGSEPVAAPEEALAERLRIVALPSAAILLSGFAAMGLEMVWFRYLSELLGQLRVVFSLLLAVILVGIWLGAVGAGWLHQRLGRPALLFLASQTLFALATLALLGLFDHIAIVREYVGEAQEAFLAASPGERTLLELWSDLRTIGLVTFVPAVFMGAAFPLANAAAQRSEANVAGRAGLLYLANTTGNVLGSALVGFVILPAIGVQRTALGLLGCAALSVVPLALSASRDRPPIAALVGAAAALAGGLVAFARLPEGHLLRASLPPDDEGAWQQILAVSEGLNETIVIARVPGYATRLFTDGHSMSGDSPKARRYMHAFSHLPLLSMEAPERVLVICFGTGNTLYAASLHPSVARLEIVDVSRHVLEQAPFFRATSHDVLDDRRVSVFVDDGRHHLLMQPPGAYDLVTLEPPPIAFAGVSGLYTRELYDLVRRRLRPGGYVSQWLPAYQLGGEAVLSMVRAFVDVFPSSVLLSGDDDELILMGTTGPSIAVDPADLARRIEARPRVKADLESIDLGTLTEIAGTFAASSHTLAAATAGAPPLTDDRPTIEYARLSRLGPLARASVPRELFDVSGIDAFCPRCAATLPDLPAYLRVRGRVYASDGFLTRRRAGTSPPFDAEAREVAAKSAYVRRLFGGEGMRARDVGDAHLAAGRLDEAIGALRYAAFASGQDPAVLEDLGDAYLAKGDPASALPALARSLARDATRPSAHLAFARALSGIGRRDEAEREERLGRRLDPGDAGARCDAGLLDGGDEACQR